MRQVGHLPELYEGARSGKKIYIYLAVRCDIPVVLAKSQDYTADAGKSKHNYIITYI